MQQARQSGVPDASAQRAHAEVAHWSAAASPAPACVLNIHGTLSARDVHRHTSPGGNMTEDKRKKCKVLQPFL